MKCALGLLDHGVVVLDHDDRPERSGTLEFV
jgi:hypothetical protein